MFISKRLFRLFCHIHSLICAFIPKPRVECLKAPSTVLGDGDSVNRQNHLCPWSLTERIGEGMWKHHGCRYFVHERTKGMPEGREQRLGEGSHLRRRQVQGWEGAHSGTTGGLGPGRPLQHLGKSACCWLFLEMFVDPCYFQLLLLTQNLILLPERCS